MSDTNLETRIPQDDPDILFMSKDGTDPQIEFIQIDGEGHIKELVNFYEQIVPLDSVTFEKNMLEVPGIGYLVPDTRVIYHNDDYVLCFGWHTNVSNQTIYSWYLESLEEDIPPRTLYKEMIDEIELVHFR